MYLIELLGLLTGLGLQVIALDVSKDFERVCHVGLLHKPKSHGIPGQIIGLIFSFLSNDSFERFWMRSLQKNIQLILELLKAPFLVLHFSYYTLMTIVMLSVIFLSTLMILFSILSVIRHRMCGNN